MSILVSKCIVLGVEVEYGQVVDLPPSYSLKTTWLVFVVEIEVVGRLFWAPICSADEAWVWVWLCQPLVSVWDGVWVPISIVVVIEL